MSTRFVPSIYALRQKRWWIIRSLLAQARSGIKSPTLWREYRRIVAGTMRFK